jgi:hypothetical protein
LRNSVHARLSDAGGRAEIISALRQGTSVVLTWGPLQAASVPVTDPLAWARRMAPSPRLIFAGFMLPILLIGLASLCLRWQDMRWQAAAVAVFLACTGAAALCARYLSQVLMTPATTWALTAANATLVAVGSLAVAPGATDSFTYWVGTGGGIAIAAIHFVRGPAAGLAALALDRAALTAGLLVTGPDISAGVWVAILTSPVLAAAVAAAMLGAFRNVSSHIELRLAEYRERVRLHARAEAINRVDNAALESAWRVAGPVLERVASGQPPDPELRMSAVVADALRDELLAPGFMAPALAERVRAAGSPACTSRSTSRDWETRRCPIPPGGCSPPPWPASSRAMALPSRSTRPARDLQRSWSCTCAASSRITPPCAGARKNPAPWSATSATTSS